MLQKSMHSFQSSCGKALIFVENDMPIGVFHDVLMELKGMMVDRMVVAHKQQQEVTDAQKQISSDEDCCKEE